MLKTKNKNIQIFSRYDKNIPFGQKYIILDNGIYTAFETIYNITFANDFGSESEAIEYLNK